MKKARIRKEGPSWVAKVPSQIFSWYIGTARFVTWREAYDWTCSVLSALEEDNDLYAPEGM